MIRMQDTVPGNIGSQDRKVAFSWKVKDTTGKESVKTTWMEYRTWEFEKQFQEMKVKM